MNTTTNGAHIEVTVRVGDPLTVTPDDFDEYARQYVTTYQYAFGILALVLFLAAMAAWIVTKAAG